MSKGHFSRAHNFFSKRNFDIGLGISSVGIPEISPYTKSEQPRIAGNHLTRHAKNDYAVVANIATLRSRFSLFFEGRRSLPRSLD